MRTLKNHDSAIEQKTTIEHQHPSISTRFLYAEIIPLLLTEAGLTQHAQNIKTITETAPLKRKNSPAGLNQSLDEAIRAITPKYHKARRAASQEEREAITQYTRFLQQGFRDERSINGENLYTDINSHFWDHVSSNQWSGTRVKTFKLLTFLIQRYMFIYGSDTVSSVNGVEHPLETELLPKWFKYCDCPIRIAQIDYLKEEPRHENS